jgi:hypothetical protein
LEKEADPTGPEKRKNSLLLCGHVADETRTLQGRSLGRRRRYKSWAVENEWAMQFTGGNSEHCDPVSQTVRKLINTLNGGGKTHLTYLRKLFGYACWMIQATNGAPTPNKKKKSKASVRLREGTS